MIDKIREIVGKEKVKNLEYIRLDICDKEKLENVFKNHDIREIIHFAAYKAVGESVEKPIMYYKNNLLGLLNILEMMEKYSVKSIIFSSSATVYGSPENIPAKENAKRSFTNPYGGTKLMAEQILESLNISNKNISIIILRYFNPVGAHKTGLIGEDPKGIPNNLMPIVLKVATGEMEKVKVFGNDYDTIDGTGVRDYIHVVDLAKGHVAALRKSREKQGILEVYNLGMGKGYSVLEIITKFEEVTGLKVEKEIVGRRSGDIAEIYADITKAKEELNWEPELDITDMCKSLYNYYLKNN